METNEYQVYLNTLSDDSKRALSGKYIGVYRGLSTPV